jgi:hypothetical protein
MAHEPKTRSRGHGAACPELIADGSNRLPVLASAINAEHDAAYGAARTALEHAAECGRLLLEGTWPELAAGAGR